MAKNIVFKIFLLTVAICAWSLLGAQDRQYRKYATQQVHERLRKEFPKTISNHSRIERFITDWRKNSKIKKVRVPMVFHVLYQNEEDRISIEQIISQIEALNHDFSLESYTIKHPADTLEKFINRKPFKSEIEFCLPQNAPDGSKTDGIIFHQITKSGWDYDDSMKSSAKGGTDPWNPQEYLNIWVVNLDNGISGYAQMPGGPTETDGIVIDPHFFGTEGTVSPPYNEGHTLTHLMGNYLGLFDLWRDGERCLDDKVDDTPVHNSPNNECPGYKHVSTCFNNPVEMPMNFMDNTYDACLNMFTIGQMLRMHAILSNQGPRGKLKETKTKCNTNSIKTDLLAGEPLGSPKDLASESVKPYQYQLSVYPNPANNEVNLSFNDFPDGELIISVFNPLGAAFYESTYRYNGGFFEVTVESSDWPSGIYYIKAQVEDHISVRQISILKP